MKTKTVILILFVCFIQLNKAQDISLLNLGINTDFITIPLTENSLISNNTSINICYNFSDKLNFTIGYEALVIKENLNMKYSNSSGLLLGFGYNLNNNKSDFNTELFASYTNAFKNFSSFDNYHSDLGIRFYYNKMIYIGTAIRYSNINLPISANRNNINWYWQMGIKLHILKKE